MIVGALALAVIAGCSAGPESGRTSASGRGRSAAAIAGPLPDSAYYMQPGLPSWVDTATGYDTSRKWKLSGGAWPVAVFMNPGQAPQLLAGMEAGVFQSKLQPFGIRPEVEPIDGSKRAFHALQRSKWPFIYVPLTVFLNYSRTQRNEGGAGGLQYVMLAGAAAGGSQTLLAHDPTIKTVADLKGKSVGMPMGSPVRGVLLEEAANAVGLKVGTGPDDIHIDMSYESNSAVLNRYIAGKYDAVISMSVTKAQLVSLGSHYVTGFPDTPDVMVLAVERTVLEQKPDVVRAFLEAHYEGQKLVAPTFDTRGIAQLVRAWNDYFRSQPAEPQAPQRLVGSTAEYKTMLANVRPDDRLTRSYLTKCFDFIDAYHEWELAGAVDRSKLVDYDAYNEVLRAHGEPALQ